MALMEDSIIHHVCIVLLLLWLLSSINRCHSIAYFISLIYLFLVHKRYVKRLRRKLRFEEKRNSNQRRVLSDSETVRWLNHTIEKIWPVCMEQIVSQKILLPVMPWFLQKYKPWTAKEVVVQHLYMGRSPPMITKMRVLQQSTSDDHLVLELGMNFRTADDMSAILAVKLRKRLGFGMWVKLHLLGMHVEGKVVVGVKFLRHWPFLGRLRVCFVEPPYFQMTVKPLFTHGLDVTELPGIAGWLDELLAVVFEQTLVEPNMLVVDLEKFVPPQPENPSSVYEEEPVVAYALVEVIEAADLKPSDLNGLADPYVKLGPYGLRTDTQRKTLAPKWQEEFKVPIYTWESPNVLTIEVHDKDHIHDDNLGDCSITIGEHKDGQRHDMWLPLQNVKMGRLHLAITVVEGNKKGQDQSCDGEILKDNNERNSIPNETAQAGCLSSGLSEKSSKVSDKFEPIDIEGQKETGIWVYRPGSEVSKIWEPRKGQTRLLDGQICGEGSDHIESFKSSVSGPNNNNSSSTDDSQEDNKGHTRNRVMRGLHKIGSIFRSNSRKEDDISSKIEEPDRSPNVNLKEVDTKKIGELIVEDNMSAPSPVVPPIEVPKAEVTEIPEGVGQESPSRTPVKDMAKSILKQAGKSARGFRQSFSRKGSKKMRGDSRSVVAEKDIPEGSELSDEESLPSPVCTSVTTEIPVVSEPILDDSYKSEEVNGQTTVNGSSMNVEDLINKVSLDDLQMMGDKPSTKSEQNDDELVKESSDPKNSEEN
ncbi:hypothetical protein ACSBR2_027957 [Camellia fascicularis]